MEQRGPTGDPPGDPLADDAALAEALRALRACEERFRDMSELSSDWYWEQDAQLRFSYFSGSLLSRTGMSRTSLLGRHRWDVPALNLSDDDWARHRAALERHEAFHDFVMCRRSADGAEHWSSISGRPTFDDAGRFTGYRGIGRDITAWRVREDTLSRFRAAIDATADGIHIVDPETMRFIDVNETACRCLGYSRDEFLSMRIIDIAPDADLDRLTALYQRLFTSEDSEQAAEIVHRHRDGRRIPIEIRRRGVVIGGRRLCVNVVRDITANKRTEATIRRHALQQSLIAGFGQAALATSDADALMERVSALICEGLDVRTSRVVELADDTRSLVLKAGAGWPPMALGRAVPDPGGRLRRVMAGTAPVFIDEPGAAPQPSRGVEVAIVGSGGAYGVLGAYADCDDAFTQENADFLQTLANTLATAIDRARAERRLTYLAQFDGLTGLPNRTLFLDRVAQALAIAQRNDWLTGVVFVDLDHFKAINDTLGHAAGDRLLVQVAQRLQECVRSGDTVGRLSGDEFAFVLANLARADDAALVAKKVVAALSQPFKIGGHEVQVSASVGIAIHPLDGDDADALLKSADTAMYRAKARGRNGYQFYLPQMNERAVERMQLEGELRGALARGEFVLHYEPRFALRDRALAGFDARLQWRHPLRGQVPPGEFMPVLEDTGLIVAVDEWMLRSACEQVARWQSIGLAAPPVVVTLSARQLQRRGLEDRIAAALAASGVDGSSLVLALAESALAADAADEAERVLGRIKALGVRLGLCNFGGGTLGVPALKRWPLDVLMLAPALVQEVAHGSADAAIVRALIELGHALQRRVAAVAIDDPASLALLREHGCDEVQGPQLAPPMTADDATRLLAEAA